MFLLTQQASPCSSKQETHSTSAEHDTAEKRKKRKREMKRYKRRSERNRNGVNKKGKTENEQGK